jgi:hypothetical protein
VNIRLMQPHKKFFSAGLSNGFGQLPTIGEFAMNDKPFSGKKVSVGWALIGLGLILTYNLLHQKSDRIPLFLLDALIFFGPAFLIAGTVLVLRRGAWNRRIFSRGFFLQVGLIMLILGGFPWIYTPLIIRDGGMEGSGMLGTIIFILVGLPGLIVTVLSLLMRD